MILTGRFSGLDLWHATRKMCTSSIGKHKYDQHKLLRQINPEVHISTYCRPTARNSKLTPWNHAPAGLQQPPPPTFPSIYPALVSDNTPPPTPSVPHRLYPAGPNERCSHPIQHPSACPRTIPHALRYRTAGPAQGSCIRRRRGTTVASRS